MCQFTSVIHIKVYCSSLRISIFLKIQSNLRPCGKYRYVTLRAGTYCNHALPSEWTEDIQGLQKSLSIDKSDQHCNLSIHRSYIKFSFQAKGVNLACVRSCVVVAEERPRITLTAAFSTLFSGLGLSARSVSTSFGCRVNVAICTQVFWSLTYSVVLFPPQFRFSLCTSYCYSRKQGLSFTSLKYFSYRITYRP